MAIIRKKELKAMNKDELLSKLEELRKDLIKQNAQIAVGTVPKSPGQVRNMKKLIAKIMFTLKEKEDVETSVLENRRFSAQSKTVSKTSEEVKPKENMEVTKDKDE